MKLDIKDQAEVCTYLGSTECKEPTSFVIVHDTNIDTFDHIEVANKLVDRWNTFEEGGLIKKALEYINFECRSEESCEGCKYDSGKGDCLFTELRDEVIIELYKLLGE